MVEQKKSSRRIRFERVAARRVTNILEQLRLLGQLANPVTYTYGEEDAEKILDALDLAVAQVHEVFRTGQGRRKRPFRLTMPAATAVGERLQLGDVSLVVGQAVEREDGAVFEVRQIREGGESMLLCTVSQAEDAGRPRVRLTLPFCCQEDKPLDLRHDKSHYLI